MIKSPGLLPFILIAAMQTFFSCANNHPSPEQDQMVRLAKLVIDSTQLESYKAALKEEIEASVRLEPGVLTLYAVAEKTIRPTSRFWKYTQIRTPTRHICKRRTLGSGKNSLEVSEIGLGCMGMSIGYGPAGKKSEMIKVIFGFA